MLSQNVMKWLLLTMKRTSPESVQICENKEDSEASDRAPNIDKLSRLRSVLKTVAEGYELRKRHSMTNKANVEPPERACIIKETSKEENVTEDTSDKDYHY